MKNLLVLGLTATAFAACSDRDATHVLPPTRAREPLAPVASAAPPAVSAVSPEASAGAREPAATPLEAPAAEPIALEPVAAPANPTEPAPAAPAARYVLATAVSTDSGASTYVTVLDSLMSKQVDLTRARAFSGWSDLAVAGEWVFVSSGEAPVVSRFSVGDDLALVDAGTISFANYVADANFYNQKVISATQAYLLGEGELIIWNPSALEITGTLALPELPVQAGIQPYVALDRGAVVRDGKLYASVTGSPGSSATPGSWSCSTLPREPAPSSRGCPGTAADTPRPAWTA